MAWRGSISRSLMSTARSSTFRSSSTPLSAPSRIHLRPPRRFSFSNPRLLGELGCAQSLMMPLSAGPRLTSHLAVSVRACCELSHGTFRHRSSQDRYYYY